MSTTERKIPLAHPEWQTRLDNARQALFDLAEEIAWLEGQAAVSARVQLGAAQDRVVEALGALRVAASLNR